MGNKTALGDLAGENTSEKFGEHTHQRHVGGKREMISKIKFWAGRNGLIFLAVADVFAGRYLNPRECKEAHTITNESWFPS